MRPAIGWSDFARAAMALGINDPSQLSSLASILDLEPTRDTDDPGRRDIGATSTVDVPWESPGQSLEAPYEPVLEEVYAPRDGSPAAGEVREHVSDDGATMKGLTFLSSVTGARSSSHLSLLEPRFVRRGLLMLLRRKKPSGEPDTDLVVEQLANAQAIQGLPMGSEMRLCGDVFIVADMSEAVSPYHEDVRHVVRELSLVLRPDNMRLLWASAGEVLDPDELLRYRPGGTGLQVLVLTSLSAVSGFGLLTPYRGAWQKFAHSADLLGLDTTIVIPQRRVTIDTGFSNVRFVSWQRIPYIDSKSSHIVARGGRR